MHFDGHILGIYVFYVLYVRETLNVFKICSVIVHFRPLIEPHGCLNRSRNEHLYVISFLCVLNGLQNKIQ